MTRDEFLANNRIESILSDKGLQLKGGGEQKTCRCPFHEDKTASFSVNCVQGTWFCHAGCGGGSVIDLLARYAGISAIDFIKANHIGNTPPAPPTPSQVVAKYDYRDALGRLIYQVVRYEPKTFRQRRVVDGKWAWGMENIQRVLYGLPAVIKSQSVWVCEGEKDANNLTALGYVATCNVGGAGKWMDGYTESLYGKDVVLCGDNDEAGRKHLELVFESLAGKVKSTRIIAIPAPHKDVSNLIEASPDARKVLDAMLESAPVFGRGLKLPLYSMAELETIYKQQVVNSSETTLDLSRWLPSLGFRVRPLVPGELVLILGDTGTGKSALLQNIAFHAKPLPTLFFELELPEELMFERFVAIKTKITCSEIEKNYRTQNESLGEQALNVAFPNLLICPEPSLTLDKIEHYIVQSELKMGMKPKLILLDYVQLMSGEGKRYERTSDAAEGLKTIAKRQRVILVMASQVHRGESDDPEIYLHSGKDSGALENSSGLVLGAWRDQQDKTLLNLKVLKNTKGFSGDIVPCNFNGENMLITERSRISPS